MSRIKLTYIDTESTALIFRGAIVVEVETNLDDEIEWAEAKRIAAARIPATAKITEGLWLK